MRLGLLVLCACGAAASADVVYVSARAFVRQYGILETRFGTFENTRSAGSTQLTPFQTQIGFSLGGYVHGRCSLATDLGEGRVSALAQTSVAWYDVEGEGYLEQQMLYLVQFQVTEAQPFVLEAASASPGRVLLIGPGLTLSIENGAETFQGVLNPGSYAVQGVYTRTRNFDGASGSGGSEDFEHRWGFDLTFVPGTSSLAVFIGAAPLLRRRR